MVPFGYQGEGEERSRRGRGVAEGGMSEVNLGRFEGRDVGEGGGKVTRADQALAELEVL